LAAKNTDKNKKKLLEDRTVLTVRALNLLTNASSTRNLQGVFEMRQHYESQRRFDCSPIAQVPLNWECRDEIIPVLAGLQHVYTDQKLRNKVVKLVAGDLNPDTRRDVGRKGMDDWQVVVLAAIRLGCNLDYDKLQDQAENHNALRGILGIGGWEDTDGFTARCIRDTLCQLKPETIAKLNSVIVSCGQELHGDASQSVRADSFVVETNIHYPTESSLIWDGIRTFVPLCVKLSDELGLAGWRQSKHLSKKIKDLARTISRISASKSPRKKGALESTYSDLLDRAGLLIERAKTLQETAQIEGKTVEVMALASELLTWIELTERVCETARRRVLLGEKVPNCEKLFSLFETHTQLYRRGKAGEPNQFGRLVLIFEDGAGFISHYHLMDRESQDADVVVEQTRQAQKKHRGEIDTASFDRGFYSAENETELTKIVDHVCVPPRHPAQYAKRLSEASVEFHQARQRHSGIESAVGALQSGNGLKRCRDHSELGFERYFGLAVLGRNIHVLGKLLIARRKETAASARSKRKAA
jgi:IS5 family transposase